MGLIKAALSAGTSVLADQWLEYIYCERMEDNVLMRRGVPKSGASNTKGTENIKPVTAIYTQSLFLAILLNTINTIKATGNEYKKTI